MSKTLEELGYEKREEDIHVIFENDTGDKIVFVTMTKCFYIIDCYGEYQVATMEELKAIYKYCEDNKWI